MHYLSIMSEEQTLVMYSGHPLGLFPSNRHAPRVVITNGMVITVSFSFSLHLRIDIKRIKYSHFADDTELFIKRII